MPKKFRLFLMTLCLFISTLSLPLMAAAPKRADQPAPPAASVQPMPPASCKPCQRPFKRLVAAMHELKKNNGMTEDEFKKAFNALVKLPKELFKDAKDMDQIAADNLYKAKVITQEQYQKITDYLKANAPKR